MINPHKVLLKAEFALIKSRQTLLENWVDGDLKWTDPDCEAACHAIEKARDIIEAERRRQWEKNHESM